jgi:hypothetical protein
MGKSKIHAKVIRKSKRQPSYGEEQDTNKIWGCDGKEQDATKRWKVQEIGNRWGRAINIQARYGEERDTST